MKNKEDKPNYKSAYWQNMHWKKQLKEMARNPEAVNEIGLSNFPAVIRSKIFLLNYKYLGLKPIHYKSCFV